MRDRSRLIGAVAGVLAFGATVWSDIADAQNFSPVAIVNDEVITGYDVAQRALLTKAASGGAATVGTDKALEMLIDDVLRMQAAKRAGIDPSSEEVRAGFDEISQLNKRDPDKVRGFFRSQGISDDAIDAQIKAEVAWRRLIRQRYGSRVRVADSDIDAAIAEQGSSSDSYRLSQLVIAVDANAPQAQADRAFSDASQLRTQITSCADIEARKSQYHRISGDVGNLTPAQMPSAVRDAVVGLEKGQTSLPVRSNDGIHVIMVCDKQGGDGAVDPKARQRATLGLQAKKLDRYSRSLMRELRREAVIDKK